MNASDPESKVTLNEQVTSFYKSKEVPDSLKALIASTRSPAPQMMESRRRLSFAWLAAAAALVITAIIIVSSLSSEDSAGATIADLVRNLAGEVVEHHVAAGDAGLETSSLDEAQLALTRLDFNVAPFPPALADLRLVAAKHCSLHGQVAAQLKVMAPGDKTPCTLYITRLSGALDGIPDSETEVDGVRVRHLRHEGRLFMLAYGGG